MQTLVQITIHYPHTSQACGIGDRVTQVSGADQGIVCTVNNSSFFFAKCQAEGQLLLDLG